MQINENNYTPGTRGQRVPNDPNDGRRQVIFVPTPYGRIPRWVTTSPRNRQQSA